MWYLLIKPVFEIQVLFALIADDIKWRVHYNAIEFKSLILHV